MFSESNWVPVKHSFNAFPPTVRRAERAEPARVRLSQSAARIARTLEGRRQNRSRTSQNQNCTVRKRLLYNNRHGGSFIATRSHAYTQRAAVTQAQTQRAGASQGAELPKGWSFPEGWSVTKTTLKSTNAKRARRPKTSAKRLKTIKDIVCGHIRCLTNVLVIKTRTQMF